MSSALRGSMKGVLFFHTSTSLTTQRCSPARQPGRGLENWHSCENRAEIFWPQRFCCFRRVSRWEVENDGSGVLCRCLYYFGIPKRHVLYIFPSPKPNSYPGAHAVHRVGEETELYKKTLHRLSWHVFATFVFALVAHAFLSNRAVRGETSWVSQTTPAGDQAPRLQGSAAL